MSENKTDVQDDLRAQTEEVERAERQYTTKKIPLTADSKQILNGLITRVRKIVFEPLFEGGSAKYACTPIGVIPGVSLIVDWPRGLDGLAALKVNQPVKIKFFHDLNLILLDTEVIALPFQPKPHVHLAWPREVSTVEVRDIRRIKVDEPSRFSLINEEGDAIGDVEGRLLDISLSGAGFFCERDLLAPGARGKLLISVVPEEGRPPVESKPFGFVCARHESRRGPKPGWIYGIEFSHLTSPDRLLIWSMIGKASELKRDDD